MPPNHAFNKSSFVTAEMVNSLPSKKPNFRSTYGPESPQFGNLRLPKGRGPHPVAVIFHGGCWLAHYANLRNSEALADALRDENIATWNVEYRCVDQLGGGWPGTFLDVGRATDHLRTMAKNHELDLDRVITIGHSAGGHLALWTAGRHKLPECSPLWTEDPLPVRGTMVLGGPGDLKRFTTHADAECRYGIITELIGSNADGVHDHYQYVSPVELVPLGLPQIMISAEHDWVVPPKLGEAYTKAAQDVGDEIQHLIIPSAGHHEFMVPGSVTWATILQSAKSLLS